MQWEKKGFQSRYMPFFGIITNTTANTNQVKLNVWQGYN